MGRMAKTLSGLILTAVCLLVSPVNAGSWRNGYFPDLEVVDQNGRKLKFYTDVIKDRQVVISFIYTTCKDLCPLTTARIVQVKQLLETTMHDETSDDVLYISLSVDPDFDTPEKLRAFADAFGTGKNWLMLTASEKTMREINHKLGNRADKREQHRNEVVLGNDAEGLWQRSSAFIEPERLAYEVLQLNPAWRNRARNVSNDTVVGSVELKEVPGQVLFRKLCSSCHTVGVGKRVGPDLRDVTERRSEVWLHDFIRDPSAMMKKGDKTAMQLDEAFPAVRMPGFGLSQNDVDDVLIYLKTTSQQIQQGSNTTYEPHNHAAHAHQHN